MKNRLDDDFYLVLRPVFTRMPAILGSQPWNQFIFNEVEPL